MPELPEVETIVRQLRHKIVGKTILSLTINDKKVIDQFIPRILPSKIISVHRTGKSIIIQLEQGHNLLIHLRMTGHFYHVTNPGDASYKKYLSGVFTLNNHFLLTFNEIRRFGSVRLFNDQQLQQELSCLGPEPLEITSSEFVALLKEYPSAVIKTKLLDQACIAGLGNIYAQEMLFHAGIKPAHKIKDISNHKLVKLHQEMQRILLLAIKNNGTTVENYSHLTGKGNFQNFLAVYGRDYCPGNHALEKINLGGRGTSFCPQCQD